MLTKRDIIVDQTNKMLVGFDYSYHPIPNGILYIINYSKISPLRVIKFGKDMFEVKNFLSNRFSVKVMGLPENGNYLIKIIVYEQEGNNN